MSLVQQTNIQAKQNTQRLDLKRRNARTSTGGISESVAIQQTLNSVRIFWVSFKFHLFFGFQEYLKVYKHIRFGPKFNVWYIHQCV